MSRDYGYASTVMTRDILFPPQSAIAGPPASNSLALV